MATTKKIPPIVKFGAWMLSIIVFIVGFWHSHLGLVETRPFESEYGSLLVAGIFLLLILISYNLAVNGKKIALIFYIIGGIFFFIFNLNYFYPSYLGRKLINEETDQIKQTLTIQKNKLNSIASIKETEVLNKLKNLYEIKQNILTEIAMRGGFGAHANRELSKFKEITGSELTGERNILRNREQIEQLYEVWDAKLNEAIKNFIVSTLPGEDKNKLEIVNANEDLESFYNIYNPILDSIANQDKRVQVDSLKYDNYIPTKQIKTLKTVVDKINQIDNRVNTAQNKQKPPIYTKDDPKSKHIGKFEHTLSSVKQRIGEIDTWGMILLCLFIDLLVPLFIYLMIKKSDDEEDDNFSFWDNITGKKKPSTF
jgi:hypothetical protein